MMARMPETIRVDLGEMVAAPGGPTVTVRLDVHGQRRFSSRLWLTGKLLSLAARVSPVPIEIET
ncbi:hypothetical protein LCGC14_2111250 [marine sediment metagenome]|uniref:Uncharacterized protein n=1 Tax=marine sediment metagenome TaxID=412755 RepID=A0A0F9GK89_9ZZZZ